MSIKLNILLLKLGCFVSMQIVRKVLTSTFNNQLHCYLFIVASINSAARYNHTSIPRTFHTTKLI